MESSKSQVEYKEYWKQTRHRFDYLFSFLIVQNNNYIYFIENVLKRVIEILDNLEVDNKNVGLFKTNISQIIQSDDKLLKIFKFNKVMKILRLSLTNLEVN